MKCQFCGTVNQPDREKCERCNKPLSGSANNKMNMTMNENNDKPTNRQPERVFNPKATVRETAANVDAAVKNPELCPECGFIVNIDESIFSNGIKERIDNRNLEDENLFRKMYLYSELLKLDDIAEVYGKRKILIK